MLLSFGCESETVVIVEPERLVLTPPSATLIEGESDEWRAVLQSPEGHPLRGRPITWSTTAPEVAGLAATTGERVTVEARAPGTATLRASAAGHSATATLEVVPGPSIDLSTTQLVITGREGEQAAVVDVQIANGGHGSLSGLSTRVRYEDEAGGEWLAVGLNGTTAPTSLTVIASAVGLSPGVHQATIEVHSPSGGGVAGTLEVRFEVAPPPPIIVLASEAVGLSSNSQSPVPATAEVAVTNGGAGALTELSVTIEYPGGGSNGWLTATLAGAEAPTTLRVSAVSLGMRPGDYTARVAIRSPVAWESPVYLTVTFRVAAANVRATPRGTP